MELSDRLMEVLSSAEQENEDEALEKVVRFAGKTGMRSWQRI